MFAELNIKLNTAFGTARYYHVRRNLVELWVVFHAHNWIGLWCVRWNFRQPNKIKAITLNNILN